MVVFIHRAHVVGLVHIGVVGDQPNVVVIGQHDVVEELNRELGGVPIMPEINLEVALQPRMIQFSIAPAHQPSRTPAERNRRTIYTYRVRGQADPLLEIRNLGVEFRQPEATLFAVKNASLRVEAGEAVALVGESGSGKSVTALSVVQLLPYPVAAHARGSSIRFRGQELVGARPERLRAVRGNQISMIFQQPQSSLNPVFKVGAQIAEVFQIHDKDISKKDAWKKAVDLLSLVGIADADSKANAYPHEMSGGQAQRIMISRLVKMNLKQAAAKKLSGIE